MGLNNNGKEDVLDNTNLSEEDLRLYILKYPDIMRELQQCNKKITKENFKEEFVALLKKRGILAKNTGWLADSALENADETQSMLHVSTTLRGSVDILLERTEVDSNDWKSLQELARHKESEGDLNSAVILLQTAIKINPNHPYLYDDIAIIWAQLNNNNEAIKYFELALKCEPNNAWILCNFGGFLSNIGENSAAIVYLQRALAITPEDAYIYVNIGNAHNAIGNKTEAIKFFNIALELEPDNVQLLFAIGMAYLANEDYQIALELLNRALNIEPNNKDIVNNRNYILQKLN